MWTSDTEMSLFCRSLSNPIPAKEALRKIETFNDLTNEQKQWWYRLTPGQAGSKVHPNGHWFNFLKLSSLQICPTIPKASGNAKFCYWNKPLGVSIDGYKRIGAFPDAFKMEGNYGKNKNIIGNSVPPLLSRAIALQIRHKMWGGQKLTPYPKTMDYLEILDTAWQDHLKPREPDAPTVISLFAGGGGSSLGYSMAGYRELLAVEWDSNAVETFKLNFSGIPVYHGDIAKLSVDECMELAGIQPEELDLLDGSPPCQGFSTAGKRILNDPRNQLFREYVRLLRGLKPKVFVMENVSGLVKGKMKLVFAEIMRELKASGYQVKCQLMNAKYFYVPQSRERLIFIGVRDDLGIEGSYPKAKRSLITVRKAFENISKDITPRLSPGLAAIISGIPVWGDGGDVTGTKYFGTKRLDYDRPSRTIIKEMIGTRTALIHPSENRAITLSEAKRLGAYPDSFEFLGKYRKDLYHIGNSVPPLFMRSVANHIRQEILSKISQKAKLTNA